MKRQWSVEERESILDYLHGDVEHGVKACCYYEYARSSEILRKARREYNPAREISDCFPPWVINPQRSCFLQCSSFPNSPWRDLSNEERENYGLLFKLISHWPIITDVRNLEAIRVFDRFKRQAKEKPLRAHGAAIVGDDEIKHVVITIDYRDGVQAKKKQFEEWLASESNRRLFKKSYKRPKQDPESADHYKQLLKFLAAWRLNDELDFKGANEWTRHNRRRETERLKLRAFFREKPSNVFEKDSQFLGRCIASAGNGKT